MSSRYNPTAITGFASGDSWTLFNLASGGLISGAPALDYTALNLSPGLTGLFNTTTGIFSIETTPEPSRALLLLVGMAGLFLRRRRKGASDDPAA